MYDISSLRVNKDFINMRHQQQQVYHEAAAIMPAGTTLYW